VARGPVRRLDGEGVFEFLHPRLQILDFSPLLFDEQVLNSVEPTVNVGNILTYIRDIFLAGHRLMDERGQAFNSGDSFFSPYIFKPNRRARGVKKKLLHRNDLYN
jgi:hypothetical protein